jgi:hypothetical protein
MTHPEGEPLRFIRVAPVEMWCESCNHNIDVPATVDTDHVVHIDHDWLTQHTTTHTTGQ